MKIVICVLLNILVIPFAWADCPLEQNMPSVFGRSLIAAGRGNVIEQRNVAVGYEVGYQVGKCFDDAYYWYSQAAKSGDEISKEWIERNDFLLKMAAGKECYASGCDGGNALSGSANAGQNGHFFAPLMINGKTVVGMIDTGASLIALNAVAAKEFGLEFSGGVAGKSMTANGEVSNQIIMVPVLSVAGVRLSNVPVSCCVTSPVLIGMSFLSRVRVVTSGNVMTFHK